MDAALPPVKPVVSTPDTAVVARAESTRLRDICLTAAEAYPVFENAFLDARKQVHGSFRIFDPRTKLVGDRARAIGDTWADLIAHVVNGGVHVSLILSDFDAIARPELHKLAHCCEREFVALQDRLGPQAGRLRVRVAAHPSRVGLLPRLAMWPVIRKKLGQHVEALNGMSRSDQDAALRDQPGLARYLHRRGDGGQLAVKQFLLPKVFPATHHQKLAVFDGTSVYIGGLDLNDRRIDDLDHAQDADETWYDVQLFLDGAVAVEAEAHLERFLDETEGRQQPSQTRDLKRTLSAARGFALPFIGPRPLVDELAQSHAAAIRDSDRLIYLETQFFRDTDLADQLARQASVAPDLNIVMVLPAAPEDVAFNDQTDAVMRHGEALQLQCLTRLRDAYGARFFAGSLAQPRAADTPPEDRGERETLHGAPIVYLHAKVSVFDDRAAIVSSANLNGRSLKWDTEAGMVLREPSDVTRVRDRCMGHWIGAPYTANPASFQSAATWSALAEDNATRAPEQRQGFVVPFPWQKTKDFAETTPGTPAEAV